MVGLLDLKLFVVVVDLFVVVVDLSVVVVDLSVVVVDLSVVVVEGGAGLVVVVVGRSGEGSDEDEGILFDSTKFFSSHSTKSHILGTCWNSSLITIGSTLIFMGKVRLAKFGWLSVLSSCGKNEGTFLKGFPC